MSIQRYSLRDNQITPYYEATDGEWVSYDDHEAALDAMAGERNAWEAKWRNIKEQYAALEVKSDTELATSAAHIAELEKENTDLTRGILIHKSELATLRQQLAEAKAVVEKQSDALVHIAEYWNRSENDKAMNDALYHMIDTAEAALAAQKGGGE